MQKVLVVDDERNVAELMARSLRRTYDTVVVTSVPEAKAAIAEKGPFDLVLSDVNMPGEDGMSLLADLKPMAPDTVVVMVTAVQDIRVAVDALKAGAYDYLIKPFTVDVLSFTVERALKRRADEVELRDHRVNLQKLVEQRTAELHERTLQLLGTQQALVKGLCQLAEFRDPETGRHLDRMANYTRTLAAELSRRGPYVAQVNEGFVEGIFHASALHDIGKVGIPDGVLCKPGKLTDEEWLVMRRHPTIGRNTLLSIKASLPPGSDTLVVDLAAEIAGGHHERFDGKGYPNGVAGQDIPLSARIVTVADYYDACTSVRVYRPEPIPHDVVCKLLRDLSGSHFDPAVVEAFFAVQGEIVEARERLMD